MKRLYLSILISIFLATACAYTQANYEGDCIVDDRRTEQREWIELQRFQEDGLWGFKDEDGVVVIKPQFGVARPFSEGLAFVRGTSGNDHLTGYIDTTGELIIPLPGLVIGSQFSEGFARISKREWNRELGEPLLGTTTPGPVVFINREGKNIFGKEFALARSFNDGLARVALLTGGFAFINTNGENAFDMTFRFAGDFIDGYAAVLLLDGYTRTYIDRNGNIASKNSQ